MLGFIIGTNEKARRARLYSEIGAQKGRRCLIVPEQFSFESEKRLGEYLGPKEAQSVAVLSFSRLCNSIFREYGGLAGESVDDTVRLLLMGAALSQCGDALTYYKKPVQGALFIKKLVGADSELKNAGVSLAELSGMAEELPEGALRDKTSDLSAVFSLYDAMLTKSYVDPLTELSRAAALLDEHDFFRDTAVYIDNFTGFTGSEYKMLRAVLSQSPAVTVSLCCPDIYDRTGGTGLFSKTQRTASRLENLAKSLSVKVMKPVSASPEGDERPAVLKNVEEFFLQSGGAHSPENRGEVRVIAAADPYEEASFVACMARSLAEGGMRWRDMAIIARDLAPYEHALPDAFEKAGVPLYFDRTKSLSAHPLAALLTSSLAACRGNFAAADVLRVLKTGILPISGEDVAEFENYCFIWDIRGGIFLSPFTGDPNGFGDSTDDGGELLAKINTVRAAVLDPLAKLRDGLRDCDGRAFSAAMWEYLTESRVTEGLRRLYGEYTESGDAAFAESLDDFWRYTVAVLDKFSVSLAGTRLGVPTMTRLFELALEGANIGSLPQTLDCVSAGTADRMRPGEPKAVFVIGAAEGVFPASPKSGGLFTEGERRAMAELGIELDEGENDALLSERMYAYNAFSCASEKLFVSYPKYSSAFEEQSPSVLIRRLAEAAAPLAEESAADFPEEFWLCGERLAFDRLAAFGKSSTPASEALRGYFLVKPLWAARAQKIGCPTEPASFVLKNRETADSLFGRSLRLSPSGIDVYESCPFAYFAKSGLKLRERRKAELSPIYAGTLIHSVLQQVISAHGGRGLADMDDGELRAEIDSVLKEYLAGVLGDEENKTERFMYLYRRISAFLFRLLRRIGEEFAVSEFEPYAFELPVGGDEVSTYRLSTPDGKEIAVEGKIDRVDVLNRNGKRWVRVVDYKSGVKKLELCDVFYGINLQMLVYLFSIWAGGEKGLSGALPAGVLYMPARDTVVTLDRSATKEDAEAAVTAKFRMNGLLLDDEAVLNAMEPGLAGVYIPVKRKKDGCAGPLATLAEMGEIKGKIDSLLIKMAEELAGGNIRALPYRKKNEIYCDKCIYKAVCRRSESGACVEHEAFHDDEFYARLRGGEDDE